LEFFGYLVDGRLTLTIGIPLELLEYNNDIY